MKFISLVVVLLWTIYNLVSCAGASNEYKKQIESEWDLADRASTIEKKSEHIDKFVKNLESSGLQGSYNSAFYRNPSNSFDLALDAVKTLQQRLREISKMDPMSLAYQTAIQQITQQEQGEAREMMSVFKGCWYREHHLALWDWVFMVNVLATVFLLVLTCVLAFYPAP